MSLIASLEQIDQSAVPAEDTATDAEVLATIADTAAAVEETHEEVAAPIETVEKLEDGVEQSLEGTERLEAVAEVAEASLADNGSGLDAAAAETAEIALESILSSIGFRKSHGISKVVPATESWGNAQSRTYSTKLVIEGVMDWLKKVWMAIKSAFVRVMDKLVQFFAGLFKSASTLESHLKALKARAEKLPAGAKPAEKELGLGGVAKAFSVGGKADLSTAKETMAATAKLGESVPALIESMIKLSTASTKLAGKDVTDGDLDEYAKASKETAGELEGTLGRLPKGKADDLSTKPEGEVDVFGPFAGNSYITLKNDEGKFVVGTSSGADKNVAKAVAALTGAEVVELLNIALSNVASLTKFKKAQDEAKKIVDQTIKLSDTIIGSVAKRLDAAEGNNAKLKEALGKMKDSSHSLFKGLTTFTGKAPSYQYAAVKAAADYASGSIRNLKEEKKD